MSDQARLFVFPPARSREGSSLGLLIDAFGNDYYKEQHRIVGSFSAGWLYYSFTNPVTGRDEPKYSYIKRIDWEGNLAAIGAGIYRRDIPGTCEGQEVNALALEATPSNERLQEFVRCAAMELESQGYFAIRALSSDPRWSSGSIYLFGLDTYGYTLFSGDPYSQWYGLIAPELNDHLDGPFGGRDVVSVGDAFGETFLYYSTRNPASGMMQNKVTFVKRVVAYGLPVLIEPAIIRTRVFNRGLRGRITAVTAVRNSQQVTTPVVQGKAAAQHSCMGRRQPSSTHTSPAARRMPRRYRSSSNRCAGRVQPERRNSRRFGHPGPDP